MVIRLFQKRYLPRVGALAAVLGALALSASSALASTATGNLNVTATVTPTCTVSATALNFGSYTGAAISTSDQMSVDCTSGATWSVSANYGQNGGKASGTTRAMTDGSSYLSYELYTTGNTVWDTSHVFTGTGTGSAQSTTFTAAVPASQNVTAGSYSDTVTLTVTF